MEAKKSMLTGIEHLENHKIDAVIGLIKTLELDSKEANLVIAQIAAYISSLNQRPAQFEKVKQLSNEANVVAFSSHSQQSSFNEPSKIRDNNLIDFLQVFNGSARVLPGMKGMSIKTSKSKKMIQLRADKNDAFFQLVNYPIDYVFSQNDINTLVAAHKRFEQRIEAKMPWKDRNYLLHGQYRELITWNQLYDFYSEGKSASYKTKLQRFKERYFSGSWGEKRISTYCRESFILDYLDRPVADRQPSDRNELIKQIDAAIRQAKGSVNIAIDVQTLFNKGDRSRADGTDKTPPKLETFSAYVIEAFEMGENQTGLSMIAQLMASTRKTRTNFLSWRRINLGECFIEVPSHENKTKFVRHPFPRRFHDILLSIRESQWHAAKHDKSPDWLFESKTRTGKVARTIDHGFYRVRKSLLSKAQAQGASEKTLRAIKSFTQHRVRDIVQKLVLDLGATLAQTEKCLGRSADELGCAYDDLSIETLCDLKNKMVTQIEAKHPELKALFQRLIDKEIGQ